MDTRTQAEIQGDEAAQGGYLLPGSSELRAVIFDVDGTLADTERDGHRVAFNRAFSEFGLDWHWSAKQYGELLGITGGKERIRHYAAAHAPDWLRAVEDGRWVALLHGLKCEIYASLVLAGGLPLRPGIARLVHELRAAGVRLAIATTTTPSSVSALIRANFGREASSLFEVIGAGDIVARKKPAPDIYRLVLQELDLPAAACLVLEDSPAGLAAANAAGLSAVVTVSAYSAREVFPDALTVVSDLGEPGIASRWLGGLPLSGEFVDLRQLACWHSTTASRPMLAN